MTGNVKSFVNLDTQSKVMIKDQNVCVYQLIRHIGSIRNSQQALMWYPIAQFTAFYVLSALLYS